MKFPLVRCTAPVLLALATGCDSTPIQPTFPKFESTPRFFSGSLAPGAASGVFTFSLKVDGGARVTLGSVTSLGTGEPNAAELALSLGTPSGGGCAPTTSKTVSAALSGQVTAALRTGDYCVTLADSGSLTEPVNFTIRVVTSVGITPGIGGTKLDLFPATLARGSFSLKTFQVNGIGTLTLTLTGVGATGAAIKIGVGLWDGEACRLNTAIIGSPSADPLITTTADAGSYCVVLTDVGNLTAQVVVSGAILHP